MKSSNRQPRKWKIIHALDQKPPMTCQVVLSTWLVGKPQGELECQAEHRLLPIHSAMASKLGGRLALPNNWQNLSLMTFPCYSDGQKQWNTLCFLWYNLICTVSPLLSYTTFIHCLRLHILKKNMKENGLKMSSELWDCQKLAIFCNTICQLYQPHMASQLHGSTHSSCIAFLAYGHSYTHKQSTSLWMGQSRKEPSGLSMSHPLVPDEHLKHWIFHSIQKSESRDAADAKQKIQIQASTRTISLFLNSVGLDAHSLCKKTYLSKKPKESECNDCTPQNWIDAKRPGSGLSLQAVPSVTGVQGTQV